MLPAPPQKVTEKTLIIRRPFQKAVVRLSLTSESWTKEQIEALAEMLTEALEAKRLNVNEGRNDHSEIR